MFLFEFVELAEGQVILRQFYKIFIFSTYNYRLIVKSTNLEFVTYVVMCLIYVVTRYGHCKSQMHIWMSFVTQLGIIVFAQHAITNYPISLSQPYLTCRRTVTMSENCVSATVCCANLWSTNASCEVALVGRRVVWQPYGGFVWSSISALACWMKLHLWNDLKC